MARPVRLGLLVAANGDDISRAVKCGTSSWGGIYTPFLDPAGGDDTLLCADALSLDAVYALEDEAAQREITGAPGYQWVNRSPYGPYDDPNDYRPSRLLAADVLLSSIVRDHHLIRHTWESTDPLSLFFTVWFGAYGSSGFDHEIEARFAERAITTAIDPQGRIEPVDGLTPIQLTAAHITYTGESTFDGFIVMDPFEPSDLLRFWNARAYGGRVFPWPIGHARRLAEKAGAWLEELRADGMLNRWRRGDGTPLPPHVAVLLRPSDTTVPADLLELLQNAEVDARCERDIELLGWTGTHPVQTRFSRTFSIDVAPSDWGPSIPLPALPLDPAHRAASAEMLIAAQVSISGETDPTTTRWATLPNLRVLSELLGRTPLSAPMHRPVSEGRVIAVSTTATDCRLELVPAHEVAATLFRGSRWAFEQSDNGIFATRLGRILGTPDASAPMQPAIRSVLTAVIRSARGKRLNQLEAIARGNRGSWPGKFFGWDTEAYIKGVPLRLLGQKLLRPYLYLRCPECTIPTAMSPEELATEVVCPMCSARYPLGFALAHGNLQSRWMYRTPPDINEDHLLEAIALLATRAALGGWYSAGNATPHIFGAKLATTDTALRGRAGDPSCELDLLLLRDFQGRPQVIVGEVKHRGRIEENDLTNLRAVQEWFASQKIDCWALFGTLRSNLDAQEIQLLRAACETAPRARGNMIVPQFPIVLLEPELSAPWMDDNSIEKWSSTRSVGDLAIASCARNLGLEKWSPTTTAQAWLCQWGTPLETE